jgi:FKBP-type peptidyl-prolyl cis-trans isomerase
MKSRHILALVCATGLLAGCDSAAPGDAATSVPGDDAMSGAGDAVVGSYARGLVTGRRAQSPVMDVDAFVAGVRAGMTDEDPRYSDEEMEAGMAAMGDLEMEASNAIANDNIAAGQAFLATNGERAEVTQTASGLQYEVLVEGDGAKPLAENVVRVHYRGTTLSGETFDASYDRGEPAEFPLNRVIAGWTEGVQLMSVGSKYKFYIPQELAYGMQSPPGAPFGPGETLVFEVELLEIVS